MNHAEARSAQAGFTLIELMVTVAIVAILAAIAYPSYQNHVLKTRRTAAQGCLLEHVQFMERAYTTNLTYEAAGGGAPALPASQCERELEAFYDFQLDSVANRAFSLSASPKGAQDKDKCGKLGIDQSGAKTAVGGADSCW